MSYMGFSGTLPGFVFVISTSILSPHLYSFPQVGHFSLFVGKEVPVYLSIGFPSTFLVFKSSFGDDRLLKHARPLPQTSARLTSYPEFTHMEKQKQ